MFVALNAGLISRLLAFSRTNLRSSVQPAFSYSIHETLF